MTILIFIIILAILILVHEFGHFLVAKMNGVLVEEFGIGFPPRILSIKKGETVYSLNLIPLGGFVKVYGEEYHELDNGKAAKLKSRGFVYKKPWQRALIIIAGIIGNFILAWVLISYLLTQGVPQPTNKVIVQGVQAASPAQSAGLIKNDVIKKISVGNKTYEVSNPNDLISLSKKYSGEKITLNVVEDNKQKNIILVPRKNPPKGQGPLGIVITTFIEKKVVWYKAPIEGFVQTYQTTKQIIFGFGDVFKQLFSLHKPKVDIAGPIGIARFTGEAVKIGFNAVVEFTALLSLNLAVINILPFPALDGGKLAFVLFEGITRKRVNKNFERYVNMIGIIILLSFAVIISINDIIKIYR